MQSQLSIILCSIRDHTASDYTLWTCGGLDRIWIYTYMCSSVAVRVELTQQCHVKQVGLTYVM